MSFHVVDTVPGPRRAQFDYFQISGQSLCGGNGAGGGIRPLSHFPHGGAAGRAAIATAGWMRFYQALERELADIAGGCEPPA